MRRNNRLVKTVDFQNKESSKTSTGPKKGTTAEK